MKKLTFLLISSLVIILVAGGCINQKSSKQSTAKTKKAETRPNKSKTSSNKPKADKNSKNKDIKPKLGDKDSDGKKFGYVKAVYLFNKKTLYLEIDYTSMLYGEEAQKAAAAESVEQLDTDYYISNVNPKIRTFEIGAGAKFIMQTWQMSSEGKIGDKEINFNDFMNIFNSGSEDAKRMATSPYWIVLKQNKVVKITEQYLP
jgi:hypothetical protein